MYFLNKNMVGRVLVTLVSVKRTFLSYVQFRLNGLRPAAASACALHAPRHYHSDLCWYLLALHRVYCGGCGVARAAGLGGGRLRLACS